MKSLRTQAGILGLLLLFFAPITATDSFRTLNDVVIEKNTVSVTLSGQTKYHAFKISNPPRLIVEFANTEHNWTKKEADGDGVIIKRVRSGQFQNEPVKIARVVIDLAKMTEYQLKGEGSTVTLTLSPEKETPAAKDSEEPREETEAKAPAPVEVIAKPYSEEQKAAPAPGKDDKKKDAVKAADIKAEVPKAVLPAQAKPAVPAAAKPAKAAAAKAPVKKEAPSAQVVLPRKPITLDFEDADIRDVFRMLAIKSGINIIYGTDVAGTVSIHLENVPFDKAFATILSIKGLVSQPQGHNILRIATPAKISEERAQAVTFTKVFPLNYAKADEVKGNLDSIRTAEGRRGNIAIDARTNSLIVTDTPEGLTSVEALIPELDKRPPQVIIEAKLVEVVLTDNFDMGIQWQYAASAYNTNNVNLSIGGTTAETSSSALGTGAVVGGTVLTINDANSGGTGVSLPATPVSGQIGSFAFGLMVDNNRLTGILTALSQKGLSKILSNPRVTTINNQVARILIGQRVPFSNSTIGAGGVTQSSTLWQEVGIKLEVLPTINTDQRVTLKIKPEVSLVTTITAAGPVIASREADTTVMVKNGETIVIGGLIREEDRKLGTQVPLLGELPIIGHLFKRTVDTKERSELLVFITPQIIE